MNDEASKNTLVEFEENPYTPDKTKPEDLVRIFFIEDVSIIPVVSKRGILFGVLKKEDIISELSDIERVKKQKIDHFISKLSRKMTLDELLPYVVNRKEFVVINIFGDVYGKWSRLELLEASEQAKKKTADNETEKQKEEHALEWMIYLILEHIPRALFAVNQNGKTIFYNSHFEDLFTANMKKEIDVQYVENSLNNPDKNDFFYKKGKGEDIHFFNKDMDFYYEKIPLLSSDKTVGFLIFCDKDVNDTADSAFPANKIKGKSLNEMIESVERHIIVEAIKERDYNMSKVAENLKITKESLMKKIKKHGIKYDDNKNKKVSKK
jgi:transcriptional regulator with PAS, ATPase and Fis domain